MDVSLPALVTNIEESHAAVRDYTIAILMERRSVTQTALTHASDKFYTNLRENGRSGRRQAAFGLGRAGQTTYLVYPPTSANITPFVVSRCAYESHLDFEGNLLVVEDTS